MGSTGSAGAERSSGCAATRGVTESRQDGLEGSSGGGGAQTPGSEKTCPSWGSAPPRADDSATKAFLAPVSLTQTWKGKCWQESSPERVPAGS